MTIDIDQFVQREEPQRLTPEQERQQDQYVDTQALIQSTVNKYDSEYRESAAKIIQEQVLDDMQLDPDNVFVKVAVKYATRVALGLSPLPPMKQEEGEQ